MSTDGFNFKLGRMRLNVERKRESVKKNQDELLVLEEEFHIMCPHREVTRTEVILQGDFYNKNVPHIEVKCNLCGYATLKRV